ncbi:MAG TPA: alpha/beta hydrolase, partial [Thermopetrobacter sp.]|nr:alpha/beta hydrolase [Thermopetrobacter sp.]
FPPTLIFTGTRDLFLSLAARVHRKLRDTGVPAEIHIFEGLSHSEYNVPRDTPESLAAHRELAAFLDRHLK